MPTAFRYMLAFVVNCSFGVPLMVVVRHTYILNIGSGPSGDLTGHIYRQTVTYAAFCHMAALAAEWFSAKDKL
ncbi:hypothetical protein C1J02_14250 [Sulfitobacter sp. SK011]|nr:hypothetical protein C1J02_14250 [Sulfitobacter sp. SK011]